MSIWKNVQVETITLFAEDLPLAKKFYQDVFELHPFYEDENSAVLSFGNLNVNLLQIRQAPGLIDPAKVAGIEAGSRFQFTILVDDVNAMCEALRKRGVSLLNGPIDRPWGRRTASFADPAGHIWEIAQDL
ncbi:VOC family protein [Cohnella zeiphila]|uniref:VOC family protein n=1 Tax=Cohnella zeiphila TaxID=2761120 RepID=A0A7X0SI55_9BACL|nr:VOC family protein [Cohnella zeiphila]MBB6730392.1 VOC family protein [Cohnella zeiphila]